ncbi:hypothetical protein AKO1_011924 [Acrasis kona]|uniref:Uncharacterized protein n=1 Tax=Acrasis kona TaxID=1008807 RepID=A0AAW2Z8T4_9EUKA
MTEELLVATTPNGRSELSAHEHVASASFAGVLGCCVGFPFDTVKVRMQTSNGAYSGIMDCTQKTYREGIRRFYGGLSAQISVAAFLQSVIFGSNRVFNNILGVDKNNLRHYSDWSRMWISGVMTGVCISLIATPTEQVKVMVQSGKSKSPWISASKLYSNLGLKGLYRGWITTAARETLYYGPYFVVYESVRRFLTGSKNDGQVHLIQSMLSGGIAGCAGWFVILPTDYIKTRMQNDSVTNPQYKGIWDCAKQSYKSGGVRVFYTGLTLTLLRAFPVHSTVFITMETLKSLIL